MNEGCVGAAIALLGLSGLVAANVLYDHGVPKQLARSIASFVGGFAYLFSALWLDVGTAIALSGALTISVLALRLCSRHGLRGVAGSGSSQAWAEVAYPLAGTAALAVGWGLFGDRWLAFVPISFMAFGDNVAGLTRASLQRGRPGSTVPTIAMLAVCLAVAALFGPYWISALGAVVATAAERFRPKALVIWDDNWVVVAASLSLMAILAQVSA